MAPTIASDGSSRDFVFVDKFNVWFGKHSKHRPESYYGFLRGEIVFLRSPSEPDEYLLKRVVGLPGDWISSPDGLEIVHVPKVSSTARPWLLDIHIQSIHT
jgi:signal peptidase I